MKRKDAILIAVLINAGLLLVLMVSSIISKEELFVNEAANETHALMEKQVGELGVPKYAGMVEEKQVSEGGSFLEKNEGSNLAAVDNSSIANSSEISANVNMQESLIHPLPEVVAGDKQEIQENTTIPQEQQEIKKSKIVQSPVKKVLVKKGDTLEKIAKRNNVTISALKRANHLHSNFLKIGQMLVIPQKGTSASNSNTTITSEGEAFYVVKAGDNPWTIAIKHNIKVDDLLKMNNLNKEKAKRLKPGDKLRVR